MNVKIRLAIIIFLGAILIGSVWYVNQHGMWDYFSIEKRTERRAYQFSKTARDLQFTALEVKIDASQMLSPEEREKLAEKVENRGLDVGKEVAITKMTEDLSILNASDRQLSKLVLLFFSGQDVRLLFARGEKDLFRPVHCTFEYFGRDSFSYHLICTLDKPLKPHEEGRLRIELITYNEYIPVPAQMIFQDRTLPIKVTATVKEGETVISEGTLTQETHHDSAGTTTYVWEAQHSNEPFFRFGHYFTFEKQRPDGHKLVLYVPQTLDTVRVIRKHALAYLDQCDTAYSLLAKIFGDLNTTQDSLTFSKLGIVMLSYEHGIFYPWDPQPFSKPSIAVLPYLLEDLHEMEATGGFHANIGEISHQWWEGSLRSEDKEGIWDDWLTQGGPAYSKYLIDEEMFDPTRAIEEIRKDSDALRPKHAAGIRFKYRYGFMLRTLQYIIGKEAFSRTLRDLFSQYHFRSIDKDGFAAFVMKENPQTQLDWFFPLFFKPGDFVPVDYELKNVSIDSTQRGRYKVRFSVADKDLVEGKRKTAVLPFKFSVQVKTKSPSKDIVINNIALDQSGEKQVTCETVARPDSILLDPEMWLIGVDRNYLDNIWTAQKGVLSEEVGEGKPARVVKVR